MRPNNTTVKAIGRFGGDKRAMPPNSAPNNFKERPYRASIECKKTYRSLQHSPRHPSLWGGDSQPPPHKLGCLGECCKLL